MATDVSVKSDTLLAQQENAKLAPALPHEERELISAIFSTDEVDTEPPNMYALFPSGLLVDMDITLRKEVSLSSYPLLCAACCGASN